MQVLAEGLKQLLRVGRADARCPAALCWRACPACSRIVAELCLERTQACPPVWGMHCCVLAAHLQARMHCTVQTHAFGSPAGGHRRG